MSNNKSNTGYGNSGYRNSGNWNSGDWNSGDWNSGYGNSGYRNSGDWNSGDWNSGDRNSGYGNSGNRNSGDWNSGDWNSGYGNSGDRNSGIFCTAEPKVFSFNKPTNKKFSEIDHPSPFNYRPTEFVESKDMTEAEKAKFPNHGNVGGCLRTYSYKEMWARGWARDSEENKAKFLALPNFDAGIFFEITGIDVRTKESGCAGKVVEIEGKKYRLEEVK
jgi:PPE-repeat protein